MKRKKIKKYSIYSVPSHQTEDRTSGVDYARVLSPMKYLDGYKDDEVEFLVDVYDIHAKKQDNWPAIAKKYDLVFLNYTVLDWQYAAMGSFVHGEKKKIVMDLDDAIWFVQEDNITHDALKEMNAGYLLSCMLNDVDGITTTSGYLRNVIVDKTHRSHKDIKVMPNQIDLSLYTKVAPAKDTSMITLLHYGSSSHYEDLLDKEFVEGIDRIFREYPNVKIKVIHSFIADLSNKWGSRYESAAGAPDIYEWATSKFPTFMEEADIIVAPLRDTIYNRCKSDIKFLETASAGKPGIFSATRPYTDTIEDGVTGYVARNADDWFNALKILIDSKDKRQAIGNAAYEYVKAERQMKNNVQAYADYFKLLLTKE